MNMEKTKKKFEHIAVGSDTKQRFDLLLNSSISKYKTKITQEDFLKALLNFFEKNNKGEENG